MIDRALLVALIEEVRGLRSDLREYHRDSAASNDDAATMDLVRCIAEQSEGTKFSVNELLGHAHVVPALKKSIVAAVGAVNGKKLGKLLRRIEGKDIGGRVIECVGNDRDGVLWRVVTLRL